MSGVRRLPEQKERELSGVYVCRPEGNASTTVFIERSAISEDHIACHARGAQDAVDELPVTLLLWTARHVDSAPDLALF